MAAAVLPFRSPGSEPTAEALERLEDLIVQVARGDQAAFERVYQRVASPVFGLVLRVLRDRAQSEEVAQEVLLQVWKAASRFDASKGTGMAWVMTMAHRRAVDRVRSEQSATERHRRLAGRDVAPSYDQVVEAVETRLDGEAVRRSLDLLTDRQRESITLAYYGGYTYPEVAKLLDVPLGTVKTRIRDGLIRLRDHLGVGA